MPYIYIYTYIYIYMYNDYNKAARAARFFHYQNTVE